MPWQFMVKSTDVPKKKRRSSIPPMDFTECEVSNPEKTLKFILGIETDDWKIIGNMNGVHKGTNVTHFILKYVGDGSLCPHCGQRTSIHDYKERSWRHANLDKTVCYIHAKIPRYQCEHCGKISQVPVPWADPYVTYTKRFFEVALAFMLSMSLTETARKMMCSWKILDDIVERVYRYCLDQMDLSNVKRVRVDETSAKKHHKYITIFTDVDTGNIIFITEKKDSGTVGEFANWLISHNGDPMKIEFVASDFSDAYILGIKIHLPNAKNIFDPFHAVNLANQKFEKDRRYNLTVCEEKKKARFALLKNRNKLKDEEKLLIDDISKDNEIVGLSYQMNLSFRQLYGYDDPDVATTYLSYWINWVKEKGSSNFKTLAETFTKHFDGIINAIKTGINNGFQESLNGRVQFSKRIANGYKRPMRLGRIVMFRHSVKSLIDQPDGWY